jgi:hypothetical protein
VSEIHDYVRLNSEIFLIGIFILYKACLHVSTVYIQRGWVMLVKPHHAAAAAGVED